VWVKRMGLPVQYTLGVHVLTVTGAIKQADGVDLSRRCTYVAKFEWLGLKTDRSRDVRDLSGNLLFFFAGFG
jgi:hypothetical protein